MISDIKNWLQASESFLYIPKNIVYIPKYIINANASTIVVINGLAIIADLGFTF